MPRCVRILGTGLCCFLSGFILLPDVGLWRFLVGFTPTLHRLVLRVVILSFRKAASRFLREAALA